MIERLLTFLNGIPDDKVRHFSGGAALACAVFALTAPMFGVVVACQISAGFVELAAIGKELYDFAHRDKHTPDICDALATMLGGATVLLPIFLTR